MIEDRPHLPASASDAPAPSVVPEGPLVSVLVPAYNHEKYVGQTIDSIMGQTYGNFELLIVDDGSRDGTAAAIRACEEKWGRRFLLESQANQGLCRTLNKLLAASSGKYLTIIASDDWMLPEKLAVQVAYLESHPEVGVVHSDNLIYYENEDKIEKNIRGPVPSGWVFEKLLGGNFITACSAMIRRSCYDAVGTYDESLVVEDWDMWLRIAKKFRIEYLDLPTVVYRQHGRNMSDIMIYPMLQSMKALILKHCEDPAQLESHLLSIALGELNHFAISDVQKAREKLRELAPHWREFRYLKALPKYLLLRLGLLGLVRKGPGAKPSGTEAP
jgi:glycosyltransferase involved in cell wall biosynthesis